MSEPHVRHTESRLDPILRWPTIRSEAWTRTFLESADRDENIVAVVAVGSAVRPNVTTTDLDLVIVCKEPDRLKIRPPIEIDLRTYQRDDIDVLIGKGNDLLGWAVRYGRPLFQRQHFWDIILDRWRRRLPLPSADVAAHRADEAFRRLTTVFDLGDADAAQEQALSYLTHIARAELLKAGVYPASRPELPDQLRASSHGELASLLERLLGQETEASETVARLVEVERPGR